MPQAFLLPDIGEGTAEGEIVSWRVKPGDMIVEDQPLVEVMTDKVTVEIPSPYQGRVLELCGDVGDTMQVGSPIVMIDTEASETSASSNGTPQAMPTTPSSTNIQTTNEPPPSFRSEAQPSVAPASPTKSPVVELGPPPIATPQITKTASLSSSSASVSEIPVLAAPATRRLARERGVDITKIKGTGANRRITPDDIEAFAAQAKQPAQSVNTPITSPSLTTTKPQSTTASCTAKPNPSENPQRIPFTGIRRKIGQHLVHAKQTAPHFGYVDEVDMSEVVRLRKQLKPMAEAQGTKLAYLPFIMLAVLSGLKAFPVINASLDDAAQEIVLHSHHSLGVAVDTEQGLIVPVVHHANEQSLFGLANQVQTLAEKARTSKLTPTDVQGGTFTLTSIGSIGGLFGLPIINHPEVAILGINKIMDRPVVCDGQVVIKPMMYLSLSCDHRVVDGAMAARFLNHVIDQLQNPLRLVMDPNQVIQGSTAV